ncbi:hypothetical protein EJ08DRAFT_685734 [Tothia fuscella]|uniref:Calcineurin-like phosphoesterase domain-containing protein n=1 Tax=Tothia fuscella TaxID=1048955 RepID=A0A9P4P057_9PEZI|nr:hypothetical protein EJ08DRAFT_685734 [Tothia fuscella]
MRLSLFLLRISSVLLPLAILSTTYLYLYPLFHRCGFPAPPRNNSHGFDQCEFQNESLKEYYKDGSSAPFRLLALADPQLEGDTSLPEPVEYEFPGLKKILWDLRGGDWEGIKDALVVGVEDIIADLGSVLKYMRKQVDLVGNDYYLAHIYRTLHWYTKPTHVTVLGDLLGSQWIGDEEFEIRRWRFWNRVFRGSSLPEKGKLVDYKVDEEGEGEEKPIPTVETLGQEDWTRRIINLAGNHDIGYAGDIDESRIARFEAAFGPVNGDIHFTLPSAGLCNAPASSPNNNPNNDTTDTPTLRLIVLNSMNLDVPALTPTLQSNTYTFINNLMSHSSPVETHTTSTILLTHIPLHKEAGTCADSPFFAFFPSQEGSGIKEQNMISADLSKSAILQGIYGMSPESNAVMRGLGRAGIVLTGHDHVGCDVYHYADRENGTWNAKVWTSEEAQVVAREEDTPGLREVTLRSMMGEFGGNAGLVSAWWDGDVGRWRIEVSTCSAGVQHIWWAVHVLDLLVVLIAGAAGVAYAFEIRGGNGTVRHNTSHRKPAVKLKK